MKEALFKKNLKIFLRPPKCERYVCETKKKGIIELDLSQIPSKLMFRLSLV